MKVESLYHTGLVVSDLERAVEFYSGTLGLTVERAITDMSSEFLDRCVGLDGIELRMAYMGTGSGHSLGLNAYRAPEGPKSPAEFSGNDVGAEHVGMIVDDVQGWYKRLEEAGLNVMGPPILRDAEYPWARYAFYFQDPDGNWLEFVERGARPEGSTEN